MSAKDDELMPKSNREWITDPNVWRQAILAKRPSATFRINEKTKRWGAYDGLYSIGRYDPMAGMGYVYKVVGDEWRQN